MTTFQCPVVKLEILPHPNADKIEIAKVAGYQSIVQKGQFLNGQLAVYIPEQAIVPETILTQMGLVGKLSGKDKNRVKAIKLRGTLSQGLILPLIFDDDLDCYTFQGNRIYEGEDVAEKLGITKYDPPIPASLAGEIFCIPELAFKFEVEDFKKYPTAFQPDEAVVITEKLHGTWSIFAIVLDSFLRTDDMFNGCYIVGSKGQSAQGRFFKNTVENSYTNNLTPTLKDALNNLAMELNTVGGGLRTVFIIGETLGVQGEKWPYGGETFRAFGAGFTSSKGKGYLDFRHFKAKMEEYQIDTVPVLYEGRLDKAQALSEISQGKSTLDKHIREGVVVYPFNERYSEEIQGRLILKYVGEQYLLGSTGEELA